MPISRALLNRLRLPYKPLDIQGSKGDVLYIPDDVGVDLSVMHGVHNGDMVPIKTDSDGVVSVGLDRSYDDSIGKPQITFFEQAPLDHNGTVKTIDTSRYLNYVLFFRYNFVSDNVSSCTVNIISQLLQSPSVLLTTTTLVGVPPTVKRVSLTVNNDFVTTDRTVIETILANSGQTGNYTLYGFGYN